MLKQCRRVPIDGILLNIYYLKYWFFVLDFFRAIQFIHNQLIRIIYLFIAMEQKYLDIIFYVFWFKSGIDLRKSSWTLRLKWELPVEESPGGENSKLWNKDLRNQTTIAVKVCTINLKSRREGEMPPPPRKITWKTIGSVNACRGIGRIKWRQL